jgi:hypothetical protein
VPSLTEEKIHIQTTNYQYHQAESAGASWRPSALAIAESTWTVILTANRVLISTKKTVETVAATRNIRLILFVTFYLPLRNNRQDDLTSCKKSESKIDVQDVRVV